MSVDVLYRCGGCQAEATVTGLHKSWDVLRAGAVMDLCKVTTPTIESAAPEGWMAFDPYTGMTYCPECWACIEGHGGNCTCRNPDAINATCGVH